MCDTSSPHGNADKVSEKKNKINLNGKKIIQKVDIFNSLRREGTISKLFSLEAGLTFILSDLPNLALIQPDFSLNTTDCFAVFSAMLRTYAPSLEVSSATIGILQLYVEKLLGAIVGTKGLSTPSEILRYGIAGKYPGARKISQGLANVILAQVAPVSTSAESLKNSAGYLKHFTALIRKVSDVGMSADDSLSVHQEAFLVDVALKFASKLVLDVANSLERIEARTDSPQSPEAILIKAIDLVTIEDLPSNPLYDNQSVSAALDRMKRSFQGSRQNRVTPQVTLAERAVFDMEIALGGLQVLKEYIKPPYVPSGVSGNYYRSYERKIYSDCLITDFDSFVREIAQTLFLEAPRMGRKTTHVMKLLVDVVLRLLIEGNPRPRPPQTHSLSIARSSEILFFIILFLI